MTEPLKVHTLAELLDASHSMPEFKEAVRALFEGDAQDRIDFNWGAPPLKVLRVIMKILETCPEEPIERVRIIGKAGCSDFIGTAVLEPGDTHVAFEWDCRWRAGQMGWKDCFGEPDQIRAAREFNYQCFKGFKVDRPVARPSVKNKVHEPR